MNLFRLPNSKFVSRDLLSEHQQPILPNIGVLALVPDNWGMMWQTRHHLLIRLSRYFQMVWLNPAHEWRDLCAIQRKFVGLDKSMVLSPGFEIYSPEFWLPQVHRPPWLANFLYSQRIKRAYRLLTKRGCKKIVLYLWRPNFAPALALTPFDLSCYHIDDEYSFDGTESSPNKYELQLISEVDQVFIHSPELMKKKGKINPHTAFVPNGVDYTAYSRTVPEPPDLAPIPRPRIGYSGYIKKQLDWPLLLSLSVRHPEWSFVFVGPQKKHPEIVAPLEELSRRHNVYFLGAKTVKDLSAYPQHFDVCLLPYCFDNYTQYINPLKLYEYLASGTPIVGTPLSSLKKFSGVLILAETPEEWSAAITQALDPAVKSTECRRARQDVARKYDWELLAAKIAKIICQRLGEKISNNFKK